ncbi:sec1 family domain-containing protein 1-like [Artemia franciscana]|uniref:Uncharacterized protein n=1 Tax=Artemia franciscana TaxID=6661 RepID=A0AA88HY16_ARTSF|nr:hypothetical protein QYM36_006656 [Artemia franciscana]
MGNPDDKLRLFLIYFICIPFIREEEHNKCQQALVDSGCNLTALDYIKQWKAYSQPQASTTTGSDYYFGSGTKAASLFSKIANTSASFLKGVKSLVVKQHNLPVTKIVDKLMELKHSVEVDDYRYFDPRLNRAIDKNFKPKSPFQECIVFVLSSGNYIEYQNLQDYCEGKGPTAQKRIIYGTTGLENGAQFLNQLKLLGQEM